MIVRPRLRAWELPFFWRLSIVPRILPQIATITAISAAVVFWSAHHPQALRTFSPAPFTLLGIAISIFLGFRNNACYDRWWEARRQLGSMVGEMRSFARWTIALPAGDPARRRRIVRYSIAYTYALMSHLRGEAMPEQVARYAPSATVATATSAPDALLQAIANEAAAMFQAGEITDILLTRFDDRLTALEGVQVACERIRSTPTPFTYTLLLHRTAYAFCFLLPFGLAGTLGWATPLFCALVAYAFFGLDALGDDLQEPFGNDMNALPLSAMARTIEISLLETIGETDLPSPALPIRSILR